MADETSAVRRKKRKVVVDDTNDPERVRLVGFQTESTEPTFLPAADSIGVGRFRLHRNQLCALTRLHKAVVSHFGNSSSGGGGGVTWGEGAQNIDPRRRMYGFLPNQRTELIQQGIKIQKEGNDSSNAEHDATMKTACVDLSFGGLLDDCMQEALRSITKQVHDLLPQRYKKFATDENLIAVQPNLHNEASYLPLHLDFPRNDGFGVIIVTVAIQGSGTIVLVDEGDDDDDEPTSWSFSLDPNGECYILCGDARNKCVHGVLCSRTDAFFRETLNLRYGLHSEAFAHDEVDRHWPE